MPIQTKPVSWQPEQPPLTPAWICKLLGEGVPKPVPGAEEEKAA